MIHRSSLSLAIGAFLAFGGVAQAETLTEAIAQAYQSNPALQSQRAQLRAVDESYVQARAGFRPSLSITADGQRQDIGGLVQSDSDYGLTITQPLFTGGRVSAEVNAAMADILSRRETLRQTEAGLLLNVIQAYADVLRDQQALMIREKNLIDLTTQVSETQTRFAVGDVTRTDVAQSQASQAAARGLLAVAQAQLAISRASYGAVIGRPPASLEPEPLLPALPATLDQAFTLADQNNPAVRAARYGEKASHERIAEARAGRMPQVNLRATYGYTNNRSNYAPDIFGPSVTASASFSQPLFAGGVIQSRVREATERNNADRLQIEQAQRDVVLRVSRAWNQFGAAQAGIVASQAEVRAATLAYEGMEAERKGGQRTTLEVLSAQQAERDAELNLVTAQHDVFVAQADTLGALGFLEVRYVAPQVTPYDPAKAFNRVGGTGFVPWELLVAAADGLATPKLEPLPPPAPPSSAAGK
jgi:outer membrane protein